MRRHVSAACLLLAWLCANGAVWNVVQVVGWVKMIHDYSQVMPVAKALQITFDGSAPCELCHFSQKGRDAARDELPREAVTVTGDKLVLAFQPVAPLVVTAPDFAWPGAADDAGLTRTEPVPVPPPRA